MVIGKMICYNAEKNLVLVRTNMEKLNEFYE